ncbi:hypothetical protein WJX84_001427 [Apatococcus fuscideae]|uniref:Tyrosyl-DNA phosphodiesterase 1 n=1 Tax=Apatococcus fuscideae TaxID=2026836 RepID=A0AAW1T078_9CHLO
MVDFSMVFPGGAEETLSQCRVFGRGSPVGWSDPHLSKRHLELKFIEELGEETIFSLKNLGQNPLIIERQQRQHDATAGAWEFVDLLCTEMATILQPSASDYRFYIPSRQAATAVTLAATPSNARPAKRARMQDLDPPRCSPFGLLKVEGIPDWANKDCLGMNLKELVSGQIRWAMVSNYMINMKLLLRLCPALCSAEDLLIAQGDMSKQSPELRAAMLQHQKELAAAAGIGKITFHQPYVSSWGTHHSKAFFLEYATGVRIIIHTANLVHGDCTYKSQAVWFQDFPWKDAASSQTLSPFGKALLDYLMALQLPHPHKQKAAAICHACDFSAASGHLIPSYPGSHTGSAMHRVGHMAVRSLLSRETLPARFAGAPVLAQCSSLGSLTPEWVFDEFTASLAAGRIDAGHQALGAQLNMFPPASQFQLVWPTVSEVQHSIEGFAAGGSIPGTAKNVNKPFLQPCWRRFGGQPAGRQRASPHLKTYTRHTSEGEMAWTMMGSHNLSKAAWGTLQKKGTQLSILSYELGMLFTPTVLAAAAAHRHFTFKATQLPRCNPLHDVQHSLQASAELEQAGASAPALVTFWPLGTHEAGASATTRVVVPLPYCLPPDRYNSEDVPWTVNVFHPGIDSHGCNCNGDSEAE